MDEIQKEKFKKLISQEEERIKKELAQVALKDPFTPNGYQPKPGDVDPTPDEDDIARETTDSENNMAIEAQLKKQLDEVLKAKEKLKDHQYGLCENCSREISRDRLEALPMTPYCVNCAETLGNK